MDLNPALFPFWGRAVGDTITSETRAGYRGRGGGQQTVVYSLVFSRATRKNANKVSIVKEQTPFVCPATEFCVSIALCSPPSKSYNIPELQRHVQDRVSPLLDASVRAS